MALRAALNRARHTPGRPWPMLSRQRLLPLWRVRGAKPTRGADQRSDLLAGQQAQFGQLGDQRGGDERSDAKDCPQEPIQFGQIRVRGDGLGDRRLDCLQAGA